MRLVLIARMLLIFIKIYYVCRVLVPVMTSADATRVIRGLGECGSSISGLLTTLCIEKVAIYTVARRRYFV